MVRKTRSLPLALWLLAGLALAACSTAPQETVEPVAPSTPAFDRPTATPPESPPQQSTPQGVYRIGLLGDMTTRNVWALYAVGGTAADYAVQGEYWPSLFATSDQRFDFIPHLAVDFAAPLEQTGDVWVSSVTLRPGLRWSDGSEISAEDVAFTAATALDLELPGGWEAYDGDFLERVEAVDGRTVRFTYHTRPGLARHEFGALMGPVVSRAFWEPRLAQARAALADLESMHPESMARAVALAQVQRLVYALDPSGEPTAGSWTFSRWEAGAFVENVASPSDYFAGSTVEEYANGAYREFREGAYEFTAYGEPSGDVDLTLVRGPHFGAVRYTIYSPDAAILALLNGDVDLVLNPNGWDREVQEQLLQDPNVTLVSNPSNSFRYLAFNLDQPPLDDVAVRQAIDCVIDRDLLTQDVMQGQATPVYSPVPEANSLWHNPDVPRFCAGFSAQERFEWAIQRLKDAGYTWDAEPVWNEARGGLVTWGEGMRLPDGSDVAAMTLLAPGAGSDPLRSTVILHIEQWMNQLGLPVTVEWLEFDTIFSTVLTSRDWDMVLLAWGLGGPFPDYVCTFFASDSALNTTGYSSAHFDNVCDRFYAESDLERARRHAFRLQETLANDLPYVFLFTTPAVDAYRSDAVAFPYTEVLGGLSGAYGLQSVARPAR
jgi:peptide/nickel transport system substrate-binding protein